MANKRKRSGSGGRGNNRPANTGNATYREFSDDQAMNDWGYKAYKQYADNLTGAEQNAISNYVSSSFDINSGMRGNGWGPRIENAETNAQFLSQALDRARTPENVTSYRGFDNSQTNFKFEVGGVISDKAFNSTSLSRRVALQEFAGSWDPQTGVLMKVRVPKGSRALYTNATKTRANRSEQELLIQHGARYKVRSVRRDPSGMTYLDVDLIGTN